jgi:hypothetical protein
MRSIAGVVAALCVCAATTLHSHGGDLVTVGIRLRVDRSTTSRNVTALLQKEAEAIWSPYGIELEWTDASASETAPRGVFLDAVVERRFERPRQAEAPTVLGRVVVNPVVPNWRPIRVSFDATANLLALRSIASARASGIPLDRELGRALGRVLAHEIGHVLLAAPYHDKAGLMRAAFHPNQLAEPDRTPFRLTCSGVARLRSRLAALLGAGIQQVEGESWQGHACI